MTEVLPIVLPDGSETGLWLIRADGHAAVVSTEPKGGDDGVDGA